MTVDTGQTSAGNYNSSSLTL